MQEGDENVVDPAAGQPIPAPTPDPTVNQEPSEPAPERTFTQAELDEIIEKRVARERRKVERYEQQRAIEQAVLADRLAREGQQQPADNGPPKREDFDSLEDYLDAKADWKVEQRFAAREAEMAQTEARREAEYRQREQEQSWNQRRAEAAQRYPDFDELVTNNEDLAITPVMANVIRGAVEGPELAYHLGRNPAEALRIAQLDPVSQVLELGALKATLTTSAKPVSKAAPPIEPTKGGRTSSNDIYEEGLSTAEYIRRRNAQMKRAG